MKTQSALQLFHYWNRLRAGSPVPARAQIEPSDIGGVLNETFILESSPIGEEITFRIAGTAISSLFGRTLLNTPFRSLFADHQKPVISRLLRNCYQNNALVLLQLDTTSKTGRNSRVEILLLPLQQEKDGCRMLGCITPHHVHFWHGYDPLISIDVQSMRIIDPTREPLFLTNRPEIALAPAIAPTAEHLEAANKRLPPRGSQFVVIKGGKD